MKLLPLILLSVLFSSTLLAQGDDWELKRETDGLKVYLRDASNSTLKEVKIETTFEESMSTIISLMKDVPAYPNWVYKCIESDRLETSTNTSSLYYCKIDFPWPMSDRDFVAKSKLRQDPNTKHVFIDVKGLKEYMDEQEDIVRLESIEIHYEFIPLNDGKVKMLYRLHSDPGGSIPTWMVNMVIENGPINTVKGMREMMKQPKYKNAQLSYLKE